LKNPDQTEWDQTLAAELQQRLPPRLFDAHAHLWRAGALLIFDEITIGWRLVHGGAHMKYGVDPDLAVFAKALGNGHPMAAVTGTPSAMSGAHDSFISSTYWTESVGPVAALATLRKLRQADAAAHVAAVGTSVQRIWRDAAGRAGLPVQVGGFRRLTS
jgi:glutamate-1-semialdehyde 2,1-aminomutase